MDHQFLGKKKNKEEDTSGIYYQNRTHLTDSNHHIEGNGVNSFPNNTANTNVEHIKQNLNRNSKFLSNYL